MTDQNALAAGQGGNPSTPAPQAQVGETHAGRPTPQPPPDEDDGFESDEALRRRAATYMTQHLESAGSLIERCEHLALQAKGDRMRPIHAAARLLQADARVAQALGQLAKVERRQHTIVERIQPPQPVLKHSNSSLANSDPQIELIDEMVGKMLRYLKVIADERLDPVLNEVAEEENARAKENSAPATETPS